MESLREKHRKGVMFVGKFKKIKSSTKAGKKKL